MSNTTQTFHPTAVAAVNRALVTLGQDVTIEALSTTSEIAHARKAAFLYEGSRQAVLRDHAWTFAERVLETDGCLCLAPDGEGGGDFPFRTQRPAKCAAVRGCFGADGRLAKWRVGGLGIESDSPIARIVYTADVEDLDKWSPEAYRCLVLRLAADLAKPITGRINERQLQESAYAEAIANAKLHDSREQNVPYDAYGENYYVERMRGCTSTRRDRLRAAR